MRWSGSGSAVLLVRSINDQAMFALMLGLIQRAVGMAYDLLNVHAMLGPHRSAKAATDLGGHVAGQFDRQCDLSE